MNSIQDEETIIQMLKDQFGEDNVQSPKAREFFDVRLFELSCSDQVILLF